MFDGKRLLLGVTGGIAAYKAVELCHLLVRAGAGVRVVMTAAAGRFVTPLTFRTTSGNRVYQDLFAGDEDYSVTHVGLAQESDLMVVAPATANCLGKIAAGIADDLLSTVLLATRSPVLLAPAMNEVMWDSAQVRTNVARLAGLGYLFVGPADGELACGDAGRGRMASPEEIFAAAAEILHCSQKWRGKRVLVTAGPTREPLDPVRFLTNRSSGRMGYALARVAAEQGASVTLVSGPVSLTPPAGVEVIRVATALEMLQAVLQRFHETDVVFKAAAVADFRPAAESAQKIKKYDELTLTLLKNPDILAELGRRKKQQLLVGFAAETENVAVYAKSKLSAKNLDLIVANDLTREGAGFDVDTNIVQLIFRDGTIKALPLLSKLEVARTILDELRRKYFDVTDDFSGPAV
jgi:phosphopantothenoylcysteine decarboxylase/phosphopantothenate--cysteine ligase